MKKLIVSMVLCFSALSLFAQWERIPGEGFDVGVSPNGTTWLIGSGHSIHRWNGRAWDRMSGEASRIDVDGSHNAWVVNEAGEIHRWTGSDWSPVAGSASDIGAGGNAIWAVGRTPVVGGFNIMRWNNGSWQNIPGGAVRIDVNQAGQAWVVNNAGDAFRWNGTTWVGARGKQGRDISVGSDGSVWMLGWDNVGSGYPIYRLINSTWTLVDGALENISAGPSGVIWGTNSQGNIWRKGGVGVPGTLAVGVWTGLMRSLIVRNSFFNINNYTPQAFQFDRDNTFKYRHPDNVVYKIGGENAPEQTYDLRPFRADPFTIYVKNLNGRIASIGAEGGRLKIVLTFESDDIELALNCISNGICTGTGDPNFHVNNLRCEAWAEPYAEGGQVKIRNIRTRVTGTIDHAGFNFTAAALQPLLTLFNGPLFELLSSGFSDELNKQETLNAFNTSLNQGLATSGLFGITPYIYSFNMDNSGNLTYNYRPN